LHNFKNLTSKQVEMLHRNLFIQMNKPPILLSSNGMNRLESALTRANSSYFGHDEYPDLCDKASAILA